MTHRFDVSSLRVPIVQAPLSGGPSTVALAAAVIEAGALGFIAAGYREPAAVRDDVGELRSLTAGAFGLNLFVLEGPAADPALYSPYVARLGEEGRRAGVALGEPRFDDDGWSAKLALLHDLRVPVVSFTFGCPPRDAVRSLQAAGSSVWVTVTGVEEAVRAEAAGADAVVLQGMEAGGHRAAFDDEGEDFELSLLPLLQLVSRRVRLPLVAAGGIATGGAVAAVLCAGAAAAQVGTAFMRTREASTSTVHRRALAERRPTRLTRAFSGRRARSIVNRFLEEHSEAAVSAYPEIHHVTAPLRRAGRERGDADVVNLWAGQAHELAEEASAAEVVRRLAEEARSAVAGAGKRLAGG